MDLSRGVPCDVRARSRGLALVRDRNDPAPVVLQLQFGAVDSDVRARSAPVPVAGFAGRRDQRLNER